MPASPPRPQIRIEAAPKKRAAAVAVRNIRED